MMAFKLSEIFVYLIPQQITRGRRYVKNNLNNQASLDLLT